MFYSHTHTHTHKQMHLLNSFPEMKIPSRRQMGMDQAAAGGTCRLSVGSSSDNISFLCRDHIPGSEERLVSEG